jgi:hypothetical protein
MHEAQRVGFLVAVGRQPNVGHAAAADQFLEIKPPKRPRGGRFGVTHSLFSMLSIKSIYHAPRRNATRFEKHSAYS